MKTVKHKEEYVYNLNTTGDRIRFERTKIGMSQKELADYLHSTREQINKLENNSRNISIEFLLELSDLFGVSTDYLLCRSNSKKIENLEMSKELGLTDKAIKRLKDFYRDEYEISQALNLLLEWDYSMIFFDDCAKFLYRENESLTITSEVDSYALDIYTEEVILLQIQRLLRELKKSIQGGNKNGNKRNYKI